MIEERHHLRDRSSAAASASGAALQHLKTGSRGGLRCLSFEAELIISRFAYSPYGRGVLFQLTITGGMHAAKRRQDFAAASIREDRAVWNSDAAGDDGTDGSIGGDGALQQYCVAATVNDDLIAAVEGWRRAHGLAEQSEALGELIRLGLMSEVAKIYRLVCRDGDAASLHADASRKPRRHHRSKRGERREHRLPTN